MALVGSQLQTETKKKLQAFHDSFHVLRYPFGKDLMYFIILVNQVVLLIDTFILDGALCLMKRLYFDMPSLRNNRLAR